MERFSILVTSVLVCLAGLSSAQAQDKPKFAEKLMKPFKAAQQKRILAKAEKEAICPNCRRGRLCPKCEERFQKKVEEAKKAKKEEEQLKAIEEKKIELEEKQIDAQIKKLDEELKPWDIADDENLESPSELLQLAAQSKQDQDLADKKTDALNYLAQLGCSKDPKVQAAMMKGLKDFNDQVRGAAVNAIIYTYRGYGEMPVTAEEFAAKAAEEAAMPPMPGQMMNFNDGAMGQPVAAAAPGQPACSRCRGKRSFKNVFKRRCRRCRGGGCNMCNQSGHVMEVYSEPCDACSSFVTEGACAACDSESGCKNCCTKEILDELKKMAFGKDLEKENCYYEPSMEVRNLAQLALALCPGPKGPQTDPDPLKRIIEGPIDEKPLDEPPRSLLETDGSSRNPDLSMSVLHGGMETIPQYSDRPVYDPSMNGDSSPFRSVSFGSNQNLLNAKVRSSDGQARYAIELEGDYLIPKGSKLYLVGAAGNSEVYGSVIETQVQLLTCELDSIDGPSFQVGEHIRLGIVQE